MDTLLEYANSSDDEADQSLLRGAPLQPSTISAAPPVSLPSTPADGAPAPALVSFASLPPPKKVRRRQQVPFESSADDMAGVDLSVSSGTTDAVNAEIGSMLPVRSLSGDVPLSPQKRVDKLEMPAMLMGETQGAAPRPRPEAVLPPPLTDIFYRGRVIRPPPGLIPPPSLKSGNVVDAGPQNLEEQLEMDHSFATGLKKGNIMDLTQSDLRRHVFSREPVDPLAASRGQAVQTEMTASLWNAKQGALISAKQPSFQQSRRHHINSMATNAAMMEESIRQQSSAGSERRRLAKAKYGW